MDIISVVNQKGGVAKTFTSVNVAIGLAREGLKVLAVDLDPQGSMSNSLGVEFPDELSVTVSTMFHNVIQDVEFDPHEGILSHPEGIDFLPANIELVNTELGMVSAMSREHILGKYLNLLKDDYEVVIIDCSPTLGLVTTNALACSHQLIIPTQVHHLSVKGMEQLFDTIAQVRKKLNRYLDISGILVTMATPNTKEYKDTFAKLQRDYSHKATIFQSAIPMSTKAIETSRLGKSIFAHDPNGKVAKAYENLIQEIITTDEEELPETEENYEEEATNEETLETQFEVAESMVV